MTRRPILTLIPLLLLALAPAAHADVIVSTFEDLYPGPNNFNNNAGGGSSGQFVSAGNSFNNSFSSSFGGIWSGWAISSTTDTTSPGFGNQYSAVTGSGFNNSATYGVAFTFGNVTDPDHPDSSVVNLVAGSTPSSIEVTNTTYAYQSMSNGDSFAKKFGAGDFFLLSISGYSAVNGVGTKVGEVDFYLANFLGNNAYIVNTWQNVNLSTLAGSESLRFGLSSSDNDPNFGMNTPAYFAADDLTVLTSSVPEPSPWLLAGTGLSLVGLVRLNRSRKGTRA